MTGLPAQFARQSSIYWLLLPVSLLLLLVSLRVQAYGAAGHHQICAMAYQLVQPATKQQIDQLMQQAPVNDFAKGCSWPDEVRAMPGYRFTKTHHFINVPRQQKTLSPKDCAQSGCILSALSHHAGMLQNTAISARRRAESLLFYGHFIGDLHQPLHVSYADDLGGNKTALYFFKQPTNLHGLWDSQLPNQLGFTEQASAGSLLLRLKPGQQQQWQQGDALQWGQQSLTLTRLIYQSYRPGMLYNEAHLKRDTPIAEQRLLQAAVRLSHQLDLLLQSKE